ncbi:MAG: FHA domain-containing protein [Pseudomonadota bacterium]
MSSLVLDINDTALRVIDGGSSVAVEPGFALAESGNVTLSGTAAAELSRRRPRSVTNDYWYRLDATPLEAHAGLSRADIASAQVAALLPAAMFANRDVVVVLPSDMRRESLGLLLGVLQANQLKPVALVDATVAATRTHYVDRVALNVELGLHAAAVSRLYQTAGTAALEDVRSIEGSGLLALRDAWAKYFAAEFVRQRRFDPLHSAESEQHLYDQLAGWLARIDSAGTATLALESAGRSHEIEVERVDVINVVADHYQRLADTARALLSAGETPAMQMRMAVSGLPGLADMLVARVGGAWHAVADDAAATGARDRIRGKTGDTGRVLRELPTEDELAPEAAAGADDAELPTHVLLGARAVALSDAPLMLGAGSAQAPQRYLLLEGSPAGVSGLHCELALANGQCLLTDHSRYGTFLNGNRIKTSAALRAGDSIRVGTPGLELQLIRAEVL